MGILNLHEMVDVQDRAVQHGLLSKDEVVPAAPAVAAALPAKPITGDVSKDQVLRLRRGAVRSRKEAGGARYDSDSPLRHREASRSSSLHEEHAEVVRRAITDPAYVQDIDGPIRPSKCWRPPNRPS